MGTAIEILRAWKDGPLRQFSDKPFKGSIQVVGGNAGAYICDVHDHITPFEGPDAGIRLHDDRWLCVPCGERHESDKARRERRIARLSRKTLENQPNSHISGRVMHTEA